MGLSATGFSDMAWAGRLSKHIGLRKPLLKLALRPGDETSFKTREAQRFGLHR